MRKISPEIDLKIIEGLAAGYSNKELAVMYGVSNSYVSKIKLGKKAPYIHPASPTKIKDEFFEAHNDDITEVLAYMECKPVIVDKTDIIEYLETQMRKCIIQAKVYQEILNKYK